MKKVSILSYPSDQSHLLSLIDHGSRYEMYFGGRFRILDFILSLGILLDAQKIILMEAHFSESLENFCNDPQTVKDFPPLIVEKVKQVDYYQEFMDILIKHDDSDYFLFMNGDNPLFGLLEEPIKEAIKEDLDYSTIKITTGKEKNHISLFLAKREKIIKLIEEKFITISNYKSFFTKLQEIIVNEKKFKLFEVSGFFAPISNLYDYLNSNLKFLKNIKYMLSLIKRIPLGNIIAPMRGEAVIKKGAFVKDSLISDNCEIFGEIHNSIIFPNVTVLKKSKIENSIVLPNTVIGEECEIYSTIIDETFENLKLKKTIPTIGDESIIGKKNTHQKNSIFPAALLNGVTLIGPNCILPKKLNVGAACYIKGGTDKLILKKNSTINDTETV